MSKPPGCCIFCRGFRLSKEHIFSDWLRSIFPRTTSQTHSVGVRTGDFWSVSQYQGHSGTRKIRAVCVRCNGGWISQLDSAAKLEATPLILGRTTEVTPLAQRALAAWIAKISMVADSRNKSNTKVTQAHRNWLMEHGEPPGEWEIWASTYVGQEWRDLGLFQRNGILDFRQIAGGSEAFKGYAETTFIGMGNLAFLVVGNDLPAVEFNVGRFRQYARRIWPVGQSFMWPLKQTLDDSGAAAAINILHHMVANPRSE